MPAIPTGTAVASRPAMTREGHHVAAKNPRRTLGEQTDQGRFADHAGSVEAAYDTWTRPLPFGPPLSARSMLSFGALWGRLATTSLRFSTTIDAGTGCVLVFRRGRHEVPYTLSAREQQVLRHTLQGHSQRQIATECSITPSTVSFSLRSVMMKLGFRSRLELVPFAALAAAGPGTPGHCIFAAHGGELVFATAGRVDWPRFPDVTRCEREISELILTGKSNQEIARMRATSISTVHNQVTQLFKRLDVRDRFDLVRRLHGVDLEVPADRASWLASGRSDGTHEPN